MDPLDVWTPIRFPTRFPDGFLWGAGTAAHQVEGNNVDSDWWDWEAAGKCRGGQRSGEACDHYERFRQDFALLARLNHNAHRLSVEWARIEPRPGEFDAAVLDHYREGLDTLRDLGIEPIVTLHHFSSPRWLAERGTWTDAQAPALFERYVRAVVAALGDQVRYWITINEPNVLAAYGYTLGIWPPGRRGLRSAFRALQQLLRAHARAYRVIHERRPDARVGLAHHWRPVDPARPGSRLDRLAARLRDVAFNRAVPDALSTGRLRLPFGLSAALPEVRDTQDFFGLNYYTRDILAFSLGRARALFGREVPPAGARSAMGWEIYPEGLERSAAEAAAYGLPILVTENGVSDGDDELRGDYIVSHLRALGRALSAGIDVIGYLHWSAMDNFEWLEGFEQRFGLIAVDFDSQGRRVKPSAELYAEICRTGRLPETVTESA